MITYGQNLACVLMAFALGVYVARRMISWHITQCCRCSSKLMRGVANAHGAIIDLRRAPCLLLEHARHIHHDDHVPPGPPAWSHP